MLARADGGLAEASYCATVTGPRLVGQACRGAAHGNRLVTLGGGLAVPCAGSGEWATTLEAPRVRAKAGESSPGCKQCVSPMGADTWLVKSSRKSKSDGSYDGCCSAKGNTVLLKVM